PLIFSLFISIHLPTTTFSTLSLHDALPISPALQDSQAPRYTNSPPRRECHVLLHTRQVHAGVAASEGIPPDLQPGASTAKCEDLDRKSTRLNSSHSQISYAVFCLKKKNN